MNTLEWKEFSSSSGEITQLKKKIQKNKITATIQKNEDTRGKMQ